MNNIMVFLSNVNSVTSGDGVDKGWLVESIKDGIIEVIMWILEGLFTILTPIIGWGLKSAIVICGIIYFCSKDPKAITSGMKFFFLYLLFFLLRSAIL